MSAAAGYTVRIATPADLAAVMALEAETGDLPQWTERQFAPYLRAQKAGEFLRRGAGAAALALEVRVSNEAAQALYAALGFVAVGVRRGYYTQPVEDAVLMRKSIS
jgi:ribosomal protein S18 acetylase RimI-like enzyme